MFAPAAVIATIFICQTATSRYMGNIRPLYIKNIARELVAQRGYAFGIDFESNKAQVTKHTDITSKTIRNRVAGYITRLSVIAQREKPL
jgi:small subunit ribosomal protein S17e